MESTHDGSLPGEELVATGLADLAAGRETDCSLLLQVAAPRLGRLGIRVHVPASTAPREHLLYERLEQRLDSAAHSYYNSLIRRIVSFARALEHQETLANNKPDDRLQELKRPCFRPG
jgi:hypothetical protein